MTDFPFENPVKRVTLDTNGVAELLASFEDRWATLHGERITSAEFYARYSIGQIDSPFAMAWASYYEGHSRMTGADARVDRLAASRQRAPLSLSGPRRSLGEYLTDRCAQFADLGALVSYVYVVEFGDEAAIHAILTFGHERPVRLDAFEHVHMRTGRPHRLKYSYRLERDGEYVVRYDRDPTGHPELPEHKHVAGQDVRKPCGRLTLHDVAEEAWALVGPAS